MGKHKTNEEKVAKTIVESVNNFGLDLEAVGLYVAEQSSAVLYNRLYTVAEAAKYYKEEEYDRNNYRE